MRSPGQAGAGNSHYTRKVPNAVCLYFILYWSWRIPIVHVSLRQTCITVGACHECICVLVLTHAVCCVPIAASSGRVCLTSPSTLVMSRCRRSSSKQDRTFKVHAQATSQCAGKQLVVAGGVLLPLLCGYVDVGLGWQGLMSRGCWLVSQHQLPPAIECDLLLSST